MNNQPSRQSQPPATIDGLGDIMAFCLETAERAWEHVEHEPASEDIRACGITLFLEFFRKNMDTPDHLRFQWRCKELKRQLGKEHFDLVLKGDFKIENPAEIPHDDLETMKAIISSLEESLHALETTPQ